MPNNPFVRSRALALRTRCGRAFSRLAARDGTGACFESLEKREVLAAISWDGGGGDNLWHTAANWSGDVIPTSADDVTIDVAATPTVLLNSSSGNRAVQSLVLRENLTISGGFALTVGTNATLDGGAVLSLTNGALTGGTWNVVSGSLATDASPTNRLNGVTWNGAIALPDAGDRLSFSGAVAVSGGVAVTGASAEIGLANGTVVNSELSFPGNTTNRRIGPTGSNATFTFGVSANVHGGLFIIGGQFGGSAWSNTTVVNQGTIAADVAGQTITISPVTFTNTGTLSANPGNVNVTPSGTWTNSGTINVNTGTFTIDGTFNTAGGRGTWSRAGGTVNVSGLVSNAGNTLILDATTGTWEMTGGTLSGGTFTAQAGGGLGFSTSPANRLTGLTFNGNLDLADANDRVSFGTGVTLNGVLTLIGAGTEVGFVNGIAINFEIAFPGSAANRRIGPTASGATLTFGASANIHGGAFIIGGQYGGSAWSNTTVVNQGTIAADVAGQTITISPVTFTNAGTLSANPGNINVTPSGTWTSSGTINVNTGTLTIDGTFDTSGGRGTWTRSGGAVNVAGVVSNTGNTLVLDNTTGGWDVAGGTITGGTLNLVGVVLGTNSNSANRLSNLTLNGDITLGDAADRLSIGGSVTINGLITVGGAGAELGLTNGTVLNSEVVFPGAAANRRIGPTGSGATFTFGPSANIHGGSFILGGQYGGSAWSNTTIVNQGVITAETAAQTVTISPVTFTNMGTLNANPGNINVTPSGTWTNSGTINVNTGTLTIDGTFDTSGGRGTWTRSGGAVNIAGVISNAGNTLILNSTTGVWDLTGGTITGGTVTVQAGGGLGMNSNSANRISSLVFNGNIDLIDASDRISIGTGVTVNGVISVIGQGAELGFVNGASINSEITFPGAATNRRIGPTSSGVTLTFASAANIHGGAFILGGQYGGSAWSNTTIVNQGVITAETAGQTVTISPVTFTNAGTMNANPGNINVTPSGSWTNTGTINVNTGTLTIDGTFDTSGGRGTWSRAGGAVNIVGAVSNTGNTFIFNGTTGVWDLAGGTLTGGTFNVKSGGGLGMNSNPSNRLSNLTFNGNIDLADANDRLSFGQTVTINGVVSVIGAGAELGLSAATVLNSEVAFPGTAANRRIGPTSSGITYTFGPGANIHGGGFIIGGQYGGSAWSNTNVVNQGTINADVAGQTLTINPTIFTNAGTMIAGPGNLTVNTSASWTNSMGTIIINNVTFSIDGTFITAGGIGTWNRTGGTVNVPGAIDNNSGAIVLNAGTGEWTLTGGTITGGTVTINAGGGLGVNSNSANRLTNLTLTGNINLAEASDRLSFGGDVTINGVVTVSGQGAEIGLANGSVLNANVSFPGNTTNRRVGPTSSNATYTFGPAANIHGGSFIIGGQYGGSAWSATTAVNQGMIRAETAGQTLTINPVTFTNTGTVAANPGTVTIAPTSAAFANAGTVLMAPGAVMNVTGTFTNAAGATFSTQIRGTLPTDIGRLVVTGTATIAGSLVVTAVNGWSPTCVNNPIIDATNVFGQFTSQTLPTPPLGLQALSVYLGQQVRFAISRISDYNRDGFLNSQDFFDFTNALFALDPAGDFNHDGFINSQDFFDFISDFFTPCP